MTRFRLLVAAASVLAALVLPVSAFASCSTDIVTVAATKGSIAPWYSPGCYTRATKLLTSDLKAYSDVPSVINAAKRRDVLRKLKIAVAKKAPSSRVKVTFSPIVGSIRVSIFAKRSGRFVVAAIGTLGGSGGTLKAKLGKATRIRVSAGYVGSGDKPITVSTTLAR
jgi:hypothetical protein